MKKVMVAMSGGVDSSVALILLKARCADIAGVTLQLYDNTDLQPEDAQSKTCCSASDVLDASLVASRFGIPHYVYNYKDLFRQKVMEPFCSAYIAGYTPNPCIDCNRYIKFDALISRAVSLGFSHIATGHYARIEYSEAHRRYLLKKAVQQNGENDKDQSYVLYNMTQEQLSRTLFPLGTYTKEEIRQIALEHHLVNASKPDSQDICFVPDGDYTSFICRTAQYAPPKGNFVNKTGAVLGQHNGAVHYTIGQRKGLGISHTEPLYVLEKQMDTHTVVVGTNTELFRSSLRASDMNWIAVDKLEKPIELKAKTRYKQKEQACTVYPQDDGQVTVEFAAPQRAITPGQRIVFYDDDVVVGGGVIIE